MVIYQVFMRIPNQFERFNTVSIIRQNILYPDEYLPTPSLKQDMTQGQFLSGV